MLRTTVGQLIINEALPPDMRDYNRPIDKKSIKVILREVADRYPEKYNEISKALMDIGGEVATVYGGEASISLDSLTIGEGADKIRSALKKGVAEIQANTKLTEQQQNDMIVKLVGGKMKKLQDVNFEEQKKARNAMAMQVASGARGNPSQFTSTNVGDLLVADHRDNVIPIPILNSYSEGLDPVEYWAGSYGARKGMVDVKFATPKGGFLGKQLALAAHRLLVTEEDCGTTNGIPVDGDEPDNEGSVLAHAIGGIEAGSILTPRNLKKFKNKTVILRSPITCQAKGGVCAKCVGVRERGKLPDIGDNVGVAAAQAIAEPVSQSALSSKHTGGVVGAGPTIGGFDAINQLVQVPKHFKGGAAVAQLDGRVQSIEEAPQGGTYIHVNDQAHYVHPDFAATVKVGDTIEAGDVMSEGMPNPAELVKHKGIGAGRWEFAKIMHQTLRDSKVSAHRRNLELLARGVVNHARITAEDGPNDTLPDDIVEYDSIVRGYTPRTGHQVLAPNRAKGMYLEEPMLHYSIGTRITPKVAQSLKKHGVNTIKAHTDEPSFQPEMVRAMDTLSHADDWMVRLGGFHLKKNLLESTHRGLGTREHQESFIPALARGVDFGKAPVDSDKPEGSRY